MHANRRVLLVLLPVALVVSLIAGYLLSRSDDSSSADTALTTEPATASAAPNATTPDQSTAAPGSIGTNRPLSGTAFPDAEIVDLRGTHLPSSTLTGVPLVVNFFFSTCRPCNVELPAFAKVHAELGEQVRFVGIDPVDPAETARMFAEDRGVAYEIYLDPDARLVSAAGIANFPTTLFVNADGIVVEQTGVLDAATLQDIITTKLLVA